MLELEVSRQLGKEEGCQAGQQGHAGTCGGRWSHASLLGDVGIPQETMVPCREAECPLGPSTGGAEE